VTSPDALQPTRYAPNPMQQREGTTSTMRRRTRSRRILAMKTLAQLALSIGLASTALLSSFVTPASADLRSSIVSIAESQDQNGAGVVNVPATTGDGCNPYTAHWGDGSACGNGLRANAWCADFDAWVWQQAGVSFTYGGGASDINAWSASFYFWGMATGNWHPLSSGYTPQPGDVAVYGNLTEASGPGHSGIYVSGPADSPTVVNGNWAVDYPDTTNYGVIIASHESNTGVAGGDLDGYVSPDTTSSSPPPTVPDQTTTAYSGATSGAYGQPVTLSAHLVDATASAALGGESLGFSLGSESCSATTDADGDASCSVTLTQTPGAYTVAASFAGDPTHRASGDSATFTIDRAPTKTSYGGAGSSEFFAPFMASATLVNADTGAPISAEVITLTLGASDTCTGMTDASGTVSCSVTPTQAPGSYSIVASFAGDPLFLASSDTEPFAITKAETTTTVSAVPARSSTFGQPVTFTAVSASANTGAPTPTGSTTFMVDGTPAGSGALSGGSASTGTSSLSGGSHTVAGSYSGDDDFLPSSGDLPYTVTCDVNIAGTYQGSLTVSTTACLTAGSHVDGSLIVKPGGSLDLEGGSVSGALDANTGGVIRVCGSSIGGALDAKNSGGIVIIGDPAIGCAPNAVAGALLVNDNTNGAEVIDNTAGGAITADGDSGPGPYPGDPTTITGNGPPPPVAPITLPPLPPAPPANTGGPQTIPTIPPAAQNASAPATATTSPPAAPNTQPAPAVTPPASSSPPPLSAAPHALTATTHLTQPQMLAAAITACNKIKRAKRAACITAAKKRYPSTSKTPRRAVKKA
jgi:Big-like domain-containing protein